MAVAEVATALTAAVVAAVAPLPPVLSVRVQLQGVHTVHPLCC